MHRIESIDGTVAESFPAVPESVTQARRSVARLAVNVGATDEQLDAIRLATSEALTNVVLHAYRSGLPGQIHLRAARSPQGLTVTVADDGEGIAPNLGRRRMGFGLALIAEAADELAVSKRPQGGTELQMRFAVSSRS